MLQVSDENLPGSSSLVNPIPEEEECSCAMHSGKEESSLGVPGQLHRFTGPQVKKSLSSNRATKHATAQVRYAKL